MIITIDGPAGSGKSTVAARLADRLGIAYLDTGAMYRSVTLAALERSVPFEDADALAELARTIRLEITRQAGKNRVLLDGRDVTRDIRKKEVTHHSARIADIPAVRRELVTQQRRIAEQVGSLVTEGRDQGTVAFPQADVKFFLDASPACRAERRWRELQARGLPGSYEEILAAQEQRDRRDRERPVGALKVPPGAVVVDTTGMTIDQVVETLYRHVQGEKNTPTPSPNRENNT